MPWLDFGDNDYLQRGNNWHLNMHIFNSPFYYIDYALASSVALQFYYLSLENQHDTWKKYIKFCSLGGSYTFIKSIEAAGLKSPFKKDILKDLINKLDKKKR